MTIKKIRSLKLFKKKLVYKKIFITRLNMKIFFFKKTQNARVLYFHKDHLTLIQAKYFQIHNETKRLIILLFVWTVHFLCCKHRKCKIQVSIFPTISQKSNRTKPCELKKASTKQSTSEPFRRKKSCHCHKNH